MISRDNILGARNDHLASALEWDWGTAYEFLLSLDTLFRPKVHGVPAPWAAGVRKRLSPQAQADFKHFYAPPFGMFAFTPLHLVNRMPAPKDVQGFLAYVEAIPGDDFMRTIHMPLVGEGELITLTRKALDGQKMREAEVEEYRRAAGRARILPAPSSAEVRRLFSEMADPAATRARWLAVMREYHTVFFAQEEARLAPVLKQMLDEAQSLARTTNVTDLIERLSNGYTISQESSLQRLVLVPSVWCHPFVVQTQVSEGEMLLTWGAHPAGYRLAPGELVPDTALLVLRALSDPTRLRLLRLLAIEPRSPQVLARELKLSLPTVSHHMRELRLAGLIRFEAQVGDKEKGRENKYTVRWQSAERAFGELGRFLMVDGGGDS